MTGGRIDFAADHLISDLVRAHAQLDQPARTLLRQHEISSQTMKKYPGPIGTATIETHALDIFSFAEVGTKAIIFPVYFGSNDSEITDVIACLQSDPSRWFTHCHTGHPLGDDQLFAAEHCQKPIVLHRRPLDWFAARGEGVFITDWKMSGPALRSVPHIITDDPAFGREVEKRLTMPVRTCPPIRVRIGSEVT